MYFSIHHRFAAYLGNITKRVYLMPHPTAIGNASEDYLFGLLYARKRNRKLVTIVPHPMLKKTGLKMFKPDFLAYGNDLTVPKYGSKLYNFVSFLVSLYFFTIRILVKIFYKIFKVNLPDAYFHPSLGQDIIWRPANENTFDWQKVRDLNWANNLDNPDLKLQLPIELETTYRNALLEMGLPTDVWYVCFHVREGGYSGDYNNIRNSNIDNYIEAMRFITSKGGWVIRMGDSSMKELPPIQHIIDYSHSPKRDALMDAYLIANCSFFVGTSSGILDTALLFGKPTLLTNAVHWISQLPQKPSDSVIFKHVYSKSRKKILTLREWLVSYAELDQSTWSSSDWEFIENSSEEITEAVKELLNPSESSDDLCLQEEFKTLHLEKVQALSSIFVFNKDSKINTNDWYRFASRLVSWKGSVGKDYLAKNW